jgi:rod shape-determining protein MreC
LFFRHVVKPNPHYAVAKKIPKNFVYILVLIVPLFILFARPPFLNTQKGMVIDLTAGPIAIITWPIREIKKIVFYHQTYDEYIKLKNEVGGLRAKIANAQEIILENKRLEALLDFKRDQPYSTVGARVIGRDPSNWNALLIINKGRAAGIKVGMPVVNSAGVVGKIIEVGENKSKVILISDPNFNVAAVAQDSRESGLLSGTLQGLCRLRYLPEDSKIKAGEKIVTSKLSSTFPDGILIGTVSSVHNQTNTTGTECMVAPAVEPSEIEEVLILKK